MELSMHTDKSSSLYDEKFINDLRDCDVYNKLVEHRRMKHYELRYSQHKFLQ